ncbi:hypothetical protein [Actinoplanes sp. N902-109]|uniref:HAAS signaling domain-containing protein n=1 Tax=Actinoplanes sp. (strain N902-109) TaxID=649831 RepID=UPI000329572C|nr:hypothetical protein [Actinoplanes sp. N902-109]AGL14606.1 hypothetical protein L083_1096 [Actinoplanes sp. N902-109]
MNSTAQDEIAAYVFAVRAALGDLPEGQRDELLEDLSEHLFEVMAADGQGSLVERVGSPEAYAAELRNTAPYVGGFPDPPARPNPLVELRDRLLPHLHTADLRAGRVLGYERLSDFGRLLRPAWWVLRGYLLAMLVAALLDNGDQPLGLLPRIGGSDALAVLLVAGGVIASVWFGRRRFELKQGPRYGLYAGSAVLVIVGLSGFFAADGNSRDSYYSNVTGYDNPYSGIEDVFVYDDQGNLVTNARLLDQNGQPIHLGNASCYDEEQGFSEDRTPGVYPFCPLKAPFRAPSASADPSASPDPSASAAPGASAAPSASAAPGASAATPAPSRTPSPSASPGDAGR